MAHHTDADAIDTHFHIWDLEKFKYDWPTADEGPIFRNFSPADLQSEMASTPVKHAIFVQCQNSSPQEAEWVLSQANEFPFIKGVVAGLDLTDNHLCDVLDSLSSDSRFVGVRHILDVEDVDWITRPDVHKGLKVLEERGLTYDLLLRPKYLKYIPALAQKFPKLRMVVDHIAKPFIKDATMDGWKQDMEQIAKFPNVYCKISGLVTEADSTTWKFDDFIPYVNHILTIFGASRCIFGSDWPVCKLAGANYGDVVELFFALIGHLSDDEKRMVTRDNAIKFYNLKL